MQTTSYKGHTLTWEEHSAGEETFIFFHGYSASRQSWEPLLEYYKPLGRCVTVDLPGHGLATTPADYEHLPQDFFIELEMEAVKQIAGNRPVTLIGHSTGGLIALAVASRLPDQVKRVVSIDGVIWGPLTGLLGFAHWLLGHHLYPVFWALWSFTQISPWTMLYGVGFYVHDQKAHWNNTLAWNGCRDTHPIYRKQDLKKLATLLNYLEISDIRPLVRELKMPVLVITGDKDPVVPPNEAQWVAQTLPNAKLLVYENTGHVPHWEQEKTCNMDIVDWLKQTRVE